MQPVTWLLAHVLAVCLAAVALHGAIKLLRPSVSDPSIHSSADARRSRWVAMTPGLALLFVAVLFGAFVLMHLLCTVPADPDRW